MIDFSKNHFQLFGLEPAFQLDLARLDQSFRDLQAQVHPDKFSHAPDAERRLSMQWSTHVNEAYQTLKQPISRARYLLKLHGVDTQEETNTAMPADFLMEQMEWREAIGEAKAAADATELDHLGAKLRQVMHHLQDDIGQRLDQSHDYPGAAEAVRKLRFLDKLREEINDALEALEA
ncbi:MAG: Fe-S protein assembly co-chaperone HscB [Pseudomonadota bacterium]